LICCDAELRKALPQSEDIYLIVEVSEASLAYDLEEKLPAYARNGIREVWIFNLRENVIEVYRDPLAEGYGTKLVVRGDEGVSPLAFSDIEVKPSEVIPE
jgi:Uma2 family endonuclease